MKHLTVPIGLALVAVLMSAPSAAQAPPDRWYSIQVRAVPLAEQESGMATYRALRDRGYLVYAYRARVDDAPWLRIAVGAFASRGQAAEFGRAFAAAEDADPFVAPAPVRVLPGAGERDFVVTPSALWVRGGDGAREVFAFQAEAPNGADLPAAILPELAPDGRTLAAVYGCRLLVAAIDGDAARAVNDPPGGPACVSAEHELSYGWRPGWSASGRHVAFLDQAFWEYPIGLWVARADGGGLRCLACNRDGQSAVKWFVWHPTEDRILFVEGYAHGTVAVGGGLYSAEMDGTIRTIFAADPGDRATYEEIAGPLRIEDGFLHFRRVRWLDDAFIETSITEDRIPIGAL